MVFYFFSSIPRSSPKVLDMVMVMAMLWCMCEKVRGLEEEERDCRCSPARVGLQLHLGKKLQPGGRSSLKSSSQVSGSRATLTSNCPSLTDWSGNLNVLNSVIIHGSGF